MTEQFTIGSRGSDLALWQAHMVRDRLTAAYPDRKFTIKIIRTTGDEMQAVALSKVGDKGLFTRQIENELIDGSIDFAVHSLKDLQTGQPDELVIGAVCERERPNDILISREYDSLASLPRAARVATGSLRRRSQLLNLRPDLQIVEIRGNVPTRIEKYMASDLDALILAYAGMQRLGLTSKHRHTIIPTDVMIPAVGQGAVALEVRRDDRVVTEMAGTLNDLATAACTAAERAFLRRLEGGCQVPIGGLAVLEADTVVLHGFVGSLDGSVAFRETTRGSVEEPDKIGTGLADVLISKGAADLVNESRSQADRSSGEVL